MFVLLLFAPVVGILDGFGISLLIPVFTGFLSGTGEIEANSFTALIVKVFGWVNVNPSLRNILITAIVLILLKSVLRLLHIGISAFLNSKVMASLRVRVITGFSEMKYMNYLSLNTGHVLNTGVSEVNKYAAGMIAFLESINTLFILVGYGLAILMLSWKATVYIILFGGLVSFIYAFFNKKSKQYSREVSSNNREYAKYLIELVNFFKYLKATGRFQYLGNKLKRNIRSLKRLIFNTEINKNMTNIIQEPLSVVLIAGLFLVNGWLMNEPVSVLLIILGISYRMSGIVSQFQGRKQNFFSTIGSLEAVSGMLGNLEENKEPVYQPGELHFRKSLKLNDISFAYNNRIPVLDRINLEIQCNETVAFVGASGAGKSTLIDVLCGLLVPDSGKISVDEHTCSDLCNDDWRSKVGYVTQESIIFDTTILQNITLSESGNVSEKELNNALLWSDSFRFVEDSENGLESELGDKGMRLSGGQKQRISLARELYRSPELLVLDEATSALDSNSEMVIRESLEYLKGKITVIMIAHRLATVKHADRIFVLDSGKISEVGSFNELMNNKDSLFFELASQQNLG